MINRVRWIVLTASMTILPANSSSTAVAPKEKEVLATMCKASEFMVKMFKIFYPILKSVIPGGRDGKIKPQRFFQE